MPELLVQQVEVEAPVVAFGPHIRELVKVEDFGFLGYFGFEESIDKHVVEGKINMLFSLFQWLRLCNFGLYFESNN